MLYLHYSIGMALLDAKQPLIIITYLSYYHYCNDYYLKRSLCKLNMST